jgi:hypothetical protein
VDAIVFGSQGYQSKTTISSAATKMMTTMMIEWKES